MNNMGHNLSTSPVAVNSIIFCGISFDPSRTTLTQKASKQEFVRDDVFINQSIDPYQRLSNAKDIIAAGGSLYAHERDKGKRG
ncbi:MAG: hypothetical protein PHF56_11495 [Desulfuromonadaceae bacterium]|nr:hypothetical protein [Desulfuromonadaceae bacterium]